MLFEYYVSWLPGMSMAKLEILCEYKSTSNSSGLTQLYSQIEMFARDVKEFSLREIADHSIKSLMHTNTQVKCEVIPSRLKMGFGDDDVSFDVNVAGMDYVVGDNLVIDDIETTIRNNIWKHIMFRDEQSKLLNLSSAA